MTRSQMVWAVADDVSAARLHGSVSAVGAGAR
jgi:hypothetical protein